MSTLNKIPNEGAWPTIAKQINDNFTHVDQAMKAKETNLKLPLVKSVSEAQQKIPTPYYGQIILVGTNLPASVYKWDGTKWADTGGKGGDANVNFDNYYTSAQIDSRFEVVETYNE